MMPGWFNILSGALLFCFVICCVVAAALQILAWSRHAREGVRVSLRAIWKPEGFFDEVGLRQVHLARTLLAAGGVAYLTFGLMIVLAQVVG